MFSYKTSIWIGVFVGSTLGGLIPMLWGDVKRRIACDQRIVEAGQHVGVGGVHVAVAGFEQGGLQECSDGRALGRSH